MPIGIRPTNDFAFKKTFGTVENKSVLISLLNAILNLPVPISDVTLENPFTVQDFKEDKLSILDIRATDSQGAIFDIEMQMANVPGMPQRLVYYGCKIYTEQLQSGEDYRELNPAFSICIINGLLWSDSQQVHHAFRLTDQRSGRTLTNTLEIHTIELGQHQLTESQLATAGPLDCWLYWMKYADQYDAKDLESLFPKSEMLKATQTIEKISEITEDKLMYDSREKAIRDETWRLNATFADGEAKGIEKGIEKGIQKGIQKGIKQGNKNGKIELVQTLQQILLLDPTSSAILSQQSIAQLDQLAQQLRLQIQVRNS